MRAILVLLASVLLLLGLTAINHWIIGPTFEISGRPTVLDGDTILIAGEKLRLTGLDAPEAGQICKRDGREWPCGRDAAHNLRSFLGSQTVHCRSHARDGFGRSVATCTKGDGTDINAWLVREGWAMSDGFAAPYAREESEAKSAKRGIWSGTFDNPADWRLIHPQP